MNLEVVYRAQGCQEGPSVVKTIGKLGNEEGRIGPAFKGGLRDLVGKEIGFYFGRTIG